ncbi:MAG: hypothetical protein HC871_04395 [Rhizobiales bacterium]|nr:hypothetical protein [Hyphomicrobiales bacterium]
MPPTPLLKPLEEPPAGVVLILISHRPGQVAATLRSRCAKLPMHGLDTALLQEQLARYVPDLQEEAGPSIRLPWLREVSLGRGAGARFRRMAADL